MIRIFRFALLFFLASNTVGQAHDENRILEIVNLRVGQGDSTLILGPPDDSGNRTTVLFDAGDISTGDFDGVNILRTVLWKRGIREIDYLIISHDDADHLGGIAFGGFHGTSFLLGINNVPGDSGDDDGDEAPVKKKKAAKKKTKAAKKKKAKKKNAKKKTTAKKPKKKAAGEEA